MKIGIIGAGNIGAAIARKLAAAGHEIKIANSRGPDSILDLARNIGVAAVNLEAAVKDVQVIILSIPFGKYGDLATLFPAVARDVVVIDTSNYYPFRDGVISGVDNGKPESAWVAQQIGRATIKAWNAVLAYTLAEKGLPAGAPGRIALPIAGDEEKGKAIAIQLVETTGFDGFDAGTIADSWRQQPGNPSYCTELTLSELPQALAAANKEKAPGFRDAAIQEYVEGKGPTTHEGVVARNRAI